MSPEISASPRSLEPAVVSVVIPAKDDAGPLATCLAALGAQTRPADEIVVVDNGSSDDTARVAVAAGARVVRCEEPGIPAAAAAGFDAAAGDVLLRLDAECIPGASWIGSVLAALDDAPHAAAVTGGARFVDGPEPLRAPLAAAYLLAYAAATVPALGHLPLFGSNFAVRADAWREVRATVHRHDPDVHDDLDLAFHLGERHVIVYRRGLTMGMSMRPFGSASSLRVRLARGIRTVVVHWPHDFPPLRWVRRMMRPRPVRLGASIPPSPSSSTPTTAAPRS